MEGVKGDTSCLLVLGAGKGSIPKTPAELIRYTDSVQSMTVPVSTPPVSTATAAAAAASCPFGNGTGPRRRKFISIWRYLTLRGLFQLLGQSVGAYPMVYIALSIMLSSLSFGMFKMVLKDRIHEGYTPVNAPSRYEIDVMREFWNSTGDPMTMIVLLRAKDDGSMLRDEYLEEVMKIHSFFAENHTVMYNDRPLGFDDFCSPYCTINYNLVMFIEYLKQGVSSMKNGDANTTRNVLTYPVANIDGIELYIERNLFGVKLKNESASSENTNNTTSSFNTNYGDNYAQSLTNMDYVKVIMLVFRGDRPNASIDEALTQWELEAFKYSRKVYTSDLIDMQIIGSEILEHALTEDGQRLTPYFAAGTFHLSFIACYKVISGFVTMMIFVTVSVMLSATFYDALDWGKALVAAGAIMCPILSIVTTYGLISLLGIRTNSFMLVMPFLIMGIGVDDGFLMIHSWQRLALCTSSASMRLGFIFEEVGPSITNLIDINIVVLEIRLFCIATAIAMGLDYLYELILFGPVLAIATRCEKPTAKSCLFSVEPQRQKTLQGWRYKIDRVSKYLLKKYCKMIGHWSFSIVLLIVTVIYWYFAIIGALKIKTRLDTVKILPKDSPMQAPNQILNDIVWADYHSVTVLVNNPFDIRKSSQLDRFYQLVEEFEKIPQCRSKFFLLLLIVKYRCRVTRKLFETTILAQSTLLWLRDYQRFYKSRPMSFLDLLFGNSEEVTTTTTLPVDTGYSGYDYDKLEDFLDSFFYSHWRTFINVEETSEGPQVRKFWFSVAYKNMSTWEDRIEIMQTWRKIAAKYQDLNVTVFEPNGMFVDQMLSLKSVAVQTGVLTLMCMAVVCIIFIPNPCSVVTASIAIASISLGVFGYLSWWGFDLDPVTMAAILMSIGLSVDFTAHVSYHYQLTNRKEIVDGQVIKIPIRGAQEKLEHTLQTVGWPMIQAGASTVMCIMPLLFLQSYSPLVFLKTIFLVVSWGLIHGLVALPALLAALPDCLTNANCYRTFLSTTSERSCRYAGPDDSDIQDGEINEINVV
uniref:SSD domain-containing protein n=1 Tax=Syphacia muris TaxID=451379 RepID=A0A0N5B0M8_9BILA